MLKRSIAVLNNHALEIEHAHADFSFVCSSIQPRKRPCRIEEDSLARLHVVLLAKNSTCKADSLQPKDSKPVRKVQFHPFVQCREIPMLQPHEKKVLYYSQADYQKFHIHERKRRDAFVLSLRLGSEQKKRIETGQDLISFPRVMILYHHVLLARGKNSVVSKLEDPSIIGFSQSTCMVARAA
jgi:hypothetical protein